MKNLRIKNTFIVATILTLGTSFNEFAQNSGPDAQQQIHQVLDKYRIFLDEGTLAGQDWSSFSKPPKTRHFTFKRAFELFAEKKGTVIVELGTTRSFVHGGLIGCNSDDVRFWTPDQPENWDWGAGGFTRMAAESLMHLNPKIYTVDLAKRHIERCKIITAPFAHIIHYCVCSSLDFLATTNQRIDLLYMDTGDMTPLEPTAQLQLAEAQIIVHRDLIMPGGLILIDDVRNQTPKKFGEQSDLGKAKYALPYLLENGFEIVENEYQVLLRKKQ